jgi:leucyl aminopeptidase (aminopeptidase T)
MSTTPVPAATRSKLARSVLSNNLQVKAGERVFVEAWTHTLPWAVAFSREARRLGAQALVVYEDEAAYWDSVDAGELAVLGKPAAHEWAALGKTDVFIHLWGAGDRVRADKLTEAQSDQLFEFNSPWYATAAKAGLRGARIEIGRAYPSLARAYGFDETKWSDQLIRATMVDPASLAQTARPIAKALGKGKRLRIHDDNGTDLTLGLSQLPARVFPGRLNAADLKRPFGMMLTLPSGAVRVALDETVADGTIVANRTNYYDVGTATGGTFHFRNGKLTDAEFEKGGEQFDTPFKTGGKGRDQPGYLSIGLNPQLNNTPQVEDVELGAVMVTVGGNRQLGGKNASPFFGWIVNAGATVEVDGRALPIGR